MSTITRHTFTYQLETIIATPWCIHRNGLFLQIELSAFEGYVRCAQGADVSLTYCLVTSVWTIAPKAISGSKPRGTSLGTTVWPHVQVLRSFSSFYANSMIWALFCSLEQKTKTTTKKQTKQNKQNRRCAKVTYWNVTQQELKAESKTKQNKTKQKL